MGGWMTYQRLRSRNGLLFRKPDEDEHPYWNGVRDFPPKSPAAVETLIGDFNRMERDYLNDTPCCRMGLPGEPDLGPSAEVAEATGVDIETVKKVLRHVFLEQR